MKYRVLFPLAVLCVALCQIASSAAAQENPKTLQGLWSSPDCVKTDSLLVISKYFLMHSGQENMSAHRIALDSPHLWREADADGEKLYGLQPANGRSALLNRTNDGLLQIHYRPSLPEHNELHRVWREMNDTPVEEYSHCAKLFDSTPSLGQAEINTVFFLDMVMDEPSCAKLSADSFPTARQCQKFLFTLADQDQNGRLNRAELARFYQQISFLNTGLDRCPLAPDAAAKGADFAHYILRNNGRKDITLTDIPALIRAEKNHPAQHPVWSDFLNHLHKLHRIIAFIPSPETQPDSHACPLQKNPGVSSARQDIEINWNGPRFETISADSIDPEMTE